MSKKLQIWPAHIVYFQRKVLQKWTIKGFRGLATARGLDFDRFSHGARISPPRIPSSFPCRFVLFLCFSLIFYCFFHFKMMKKYESQFCVFRSNPFLFWSILSIQGAEKLLAALCIAASKFSL